MLKRPLSVSHQSSGAAQTGNLNTDQPLPCKIQALNILNLDAIPGRHVLVFRSFRRRSLSKPKEDQAYFPCLILGQGSALHWQPLPSTDFCLLALGQRTFAEARHKETEARARAGHVAFAICPVKPGRCFPSNQPLSEMPSSRALMRSWRLLNLSTPSQYGSVE